MRCRSSPFGRRRVIPLRGRCWPAAARRAWPPVRGPSARIERNGLVRGERPADLELRGQRDALGRPERDERIPREGPRAIRLGQPPVERDDRERDPWPLPARRRGRPSPSDSHAHHLDGGRRRPRVDRGAGHRPRDDGREPDARAGRRRRAVPVQLDRRPRAGPPRVRCGPGGAVPGVPLRVHRRTDLERACVLRRDGRGVRIPNVRRRVQRT